MKPEIKIPEGDFSIEKFKACLPLLLEDLETISTFRPVQEFISTLTQDDFILMYSEWLNQRKTEDIRDQRGFIFEILSQRYIRTIEPQTEIEDLVAEILLFLGQPDNNHAIWIEETSTPDNLGITLTHDTIYVSRIYESKISTHALERGTLQRVRTKEYMDRLVNALNGSTNKIPSRTGREFIYRAMEHLYDLVDYPVEMSQDCRYVYLLPSDQKYQPNGGEKKHFDTMNIPISTSQIDLFCNITVDFFKGI